MQKPQTISPVTSKKIGRPPGPTDPAKQHERELLAWIKVNCRVRELIEKQLSYLEKRLANAESGDVSINLDGILDVMGALGTLLTVSARTVESGIKTLDRPQTLEDKNNLDPDKIMEELHGGRT